MTKHLAATPGLPRWFECGAALAGLLLLSPLLLLTALAIKATSAGPVLFRQQRVGRDGLKFELLKFRTMRDASHDAPNVTASGDSRITSVGRWLRATKIDELPELLHILRGQMSVVGPRPEVPTFVDLNDERWQQVLSVKPGLTDTVTLLLRNEEALVAAGTQRTGLTAERFYRTHLLPFKLELAQTALLRRSAWSDVKIAFRTAFAIVASGPDVEEILDRVLSAPPLS